MQLGILKTAWDVSRDGIDRGYGHLPSEALYTWSTQSIVLSEDYAKFPILGVSMLEDGRLRKRKMIQRMKEALGARSNLSREATMRRLQQAEDHLEDPGLLHNFEFFDVPSSDFMLQFYFAVWDRRIAEAMLYLHNYGKDLRGIY